MIWLKNKTFFNSFSITLRFKLRLSLTRTDYNQSKIWIKMKLNILICLLKALWSICTSGDRKWLTNILVLIK
jgi:hypothetical protein